MNYPILALIIANIIWGAAASIFKLALENIPPFTLAFVRFLGAALIFLPFVMTRFRFLTIKEWLNIAASSFFGIALHIGFFFLGLQGARSINAPIILSSAPVFLFLGSVFFLKEKLKIKVLIGMSVAFFGVLLIVLYPLFLVSKMSVATEIEGNVYLVISTISGMVIKPILNKAIIKRVSTMQLTFLEFLFGALMFLPFALGESTAWSPSQLNVNGWTGIVFGVFFSSALAYFLFNWGISKVATQEVGIFYYIDPVVGLILGMLLLSEYPNIYYGLGALFVFLGIFIAERRLHYHPIHRVSKN